MKIVLTRSLGAGGHQEWSLTIERTTGRAREAWAAEDAAKAEAVIAAAAACPESAADICRDAMGGKP